MKVEVPLDNGITALYLTYPNYRPRVLVGEPVMKKHGVRSAAFIPLNPVDETADPNFEDGWTSFNATDLERCIAKIALCEAIRVIDPSIRDKMVARFVIEGVGDSSFFMGAEIKHEVSDNMHSVTHNMIRHHSGEQGWMTNVRIFAFLPTPLYNVVLRPNASPAT
jgi:hypothetical protein